MPIITLGREPLCMSLCVLVAASGHLLMAVSGAWRCMSTFMDDPYLLCAWCPDAECQMLKIYDFQRSGTNRHGTRGFAGMSQALF